MMKLICVSAAIGICAMFLKLVEVSHWNSICER